MGIGTSGGKDEDDEDEDGGWQVDAADTAAAGTADDEDAAGVDGDCDVVVNVAVDSIVITTVVLALRPAGHNIGSNPGTFSSFGFVSMHSAQNHGLEDFGMVMMPVSLDGTMPLHIVW